MSSPVPKSEGIKKAVRQTRAEVTERNMVESKRRFVTHQFKYSQKERQLFKNRRDSVEKAQQQRKQEKMLILLKEKVDFTVENLESIIEGFKSADVDDSKLICFEEFKKAMDRILGEEIFANVIVDEKANNFFGKAFFQAFDANNSGKIDFQELCMGLSSYLEGSMSTRLEFLFRVYDTNKDGKISRNEVASMIKYQWNYLLNQDDNEADNVDDSDSNSRGRSHVLDYDNFEDYLKKAIECFDAMDQDGDSRIDLEEFTSGIQEDPSLFELFAAQIFHMPLEKQTPSQSMKKKVESKVKALEDARKSSIMLHNNILLYMKVLDITVSKNNNIKSIDVIRTMDSLFGEHVLKKDFHQGFNDVLDKHSDPNGNNEIDFDLVLDRIIPEQINVGIAYCYETYNLDDAPKKNKGSDQDTQQDDAAEAAEPQQEESTEGKRLLDKRPQIANQ